MKVLAFDTETTPIRPGCLAPDLVCVTWQFEGQEAQIAHHSTFEPTLRAWLEDPEILFVGHNVAFDMAVLAERDPQHRKAIFAAYDADRVTDTKLRAQLLDIAGGRFRGFIGEVGRWIVREYSLEGCARAYAGMRLQKDAMRLSYGRFIDVPLERWVDRAREVIEDARGELASLPHDTTDKELKKKIEGLRDMIAAVPERCLTYPLDDARATLAVYLAQEQHAFYLKDQFRQARAAFALHLSSCHGVRTDPTRVAELRSTLEDDLRRLEGELQVAGLVRPDGSRDTKAAAALMVSVCRASGRPIRRTASHTKECPPDGDCHVALDADACNAVKDLPGGEPLVAYAELSTTKKMLSNDCEMLAKASVYPLQPRYDMAETGRTTCSPNVQNVQRGKKCRACEGKGKVAA